MYHRDIDQFLGIYYPNNRQQIFEQACIEGNVGLVHWLVKRYSDTIDIESGFSKTCFQQKILAVFPVMNDTLYEEYRSILRLLETFKPKYCLWCSHFGNPHKNEIEMK
jgi:hypothetical protein